MDTPDGTGDHENYFLNTKKAYELDGTLYENCIKKAMNIRSKEKHESWRAIDKTFLYSKDFKYVYENQDIKSEISQKKIHSTRLLVSRNDIL